MNLHFLDLKKIEPSLSLHWGNEQEISVKSISHVYNPLDHSFVFMKSKKYLNRLGRHSKNHFYPDSGVVLEEKFWKDLSTNLKEEIKKKFKWGATLKSVGLAMTTLSKPFYDEKFQNLNYVLDGRAVGNADIHPTAYISQNVFIGENVKIGAHVEILPGSVIMPNVEIAEATKIFPNVTIYPYTKIGKHCRLHAHVVIGADGFGYQFEQGEHKKIWHFSGVEIEDHVEIGATSTVDAGAFVATRIGSGTKIDNGVQVGHNAQIGRHCILCGQVAISGSVELEDYCVLGGMSGVAPGAILGKGTQVAAGSIISENAEWPSGSKLGGHPARELNQWMRTLANINKLGRDNEAR